MTDYTVPRGIVSASSEALGHEGWRAFGNFNWSTNVAATLSYQFVTNKMVVKYAFQNTLGISHSTNFTFDASNNGSSWITLDTQNITLAQNQFFTNSITNINRYLYYRMNVTAFGSFIISVANFQMFGY